MTATRIYFELASLQVVVQNVSQVPLSKICLGMQATRLLFGESVRHSDPRFVKKLGPFLRSRFSSPDEQDKYVPNAQPRTGAVSDEVHLCLSKICCCFLCLTEQNNVRSWFVYVTPPVADQNFPAVESEATAMILLNLFCLQPSLRAIIESSKQSL